MTTNALPHRYAQKSNRQDSGASAVLTAPEAPGLASGLPEFPLLDCTGFQRVLAEVADRELLPVAGLEHLSDCDACTMMLEDFEAIAEQVRGLPLFHDTGPDQWPQIREALLREGVIHNGHGCPPAARAAAAGPQPQLVRKPAARVKKLK